MLNVLRWCVGQCLDYLLGEDDLGDYIPIPTFEPPEFK